MKPANVALPGETRLECTKCQSPHWLFFRSFVLAWEKGSNQARGEERHSIRCAACGSHLADQLKLKRPGIVPPSSRSGEAMAPKTKTKKPAAVKRAPKAKASKQKGPKAKSA